LIDQERKPSASRPAAGEDIIVATGVHKTLGQGHASVHVLRGLDLSVRRGEFLAVMGPSGCGKSTLLHVLGLMTPADAGTLTLSGQAVGASQSQRCRLRRTQIGFVFQRFNLLGVLSAADNIVVSMRVRGLDHDGVIEPLLERLGVGHLARRKPSAMSIGEQQRVAVARALAHKPAVVLADEPTGNLDSASEESLLELLREINRRDGQTVVMITHSAEAAAHADRVLEMRDGVILGNAD
jgi:putative ABC transport system ATP-binding protein